MRRALTDLLLLAVAAAIVAAAANFARPEPFPLAVPDGFYHMESGAKPIRMGATRRLFDAGDAVFLDARSAEVYVGGRIEGALNLPFDEWEEALPSVEPWFDRQPVVVYAGRGEISLADDLGSVLRDHARVEKLYLYLGGFEQWRDAGLPVSDGANPIPPEETEW
ncbi:MAG: hypothetical protein GF346_08310 [Candidatus Eisenbacteria bacterium]|nr:hypothetical protein [Candidatus Latescibacterota bacterium]MBD3302436.1 hypothetical protein [Candidatus Eisenbacteria bacterium]